MKLIVILNNIRSILNVGAILRTCEGFGVERVIFSGYTPRVHDERALPHLREKLDKQIHKTALGAEEMVKIENSEDIKATILGLKEQGYRVVGLENNIPERTVELGSDEFYAKLTEKTVLVIGEEVQGINRELFFSIDFFTEIPMKGRKESFNVSVATGVAIWAISWGK